MYYLVYICKVQTIQNNVITISTKIVYFDKQEVIKFNNVNLGFHSYCPIYCACLPSSHALKLRLLE